MANLTIKEQPSGYILGKSPILYSVLSTDYTYDDFEYIIDVYLWQGDITSIPAQYTYRLNKPRNATTGATTFDISSLVSDLFLDINPELSTPDDTNNMEVYAFVKFGYSYTDGAGDEQEELNVTTSDTITVLNGYSYYSSGINYYPNSYLGRSSGDSFMTDRPLSSTVPNDSKLFFGVVYDAGEETAKIKYTISGSGPSEIVYLDITAFDEGLVIFGVGVEQLPTHIMANEDIESYTVTGVDSGNANVTDTYSFTVDNACKYGYKNMQFLNRFGVWDSIIFRGAKQEQFMTEKEEVMLSPLSLDSSSEFDFNESSGQFHNFVNNGRDTFTINTGWIEEDWNSLIKQLLVSEMVFDADTLEPYTVDTSSLAIQTALNDKVINYSLSFKEGFTFINTVS